MSDTPWRNAVYDACVVHWTSFYPDDPKRTLGGMINQNILEALDPKISQKAADLEDTYKADLEGVVSVLRPFAIYNAQTDEPEPLVTMQGRLDVVKRYVDARNDRTGFNECRWRVEPRNEAARLLENLYKKHPWITKPC